ncbi:MAG: hypothetical protein M3209_09160 [Acidobacteriota bacterium]|nr:hypothetical protein [Acidobacteriota bacterium]
MKKIALLIFLALIQTASVAAQQKGFVKGNLVERTDNLINNFAKEGYSGAVLIAQNDQILLHKVGQ